MTAPRRLDALGCSPVRAKLASGALGIGRAIAVGIVTIATVAPIELVAADRSVRSARLAPYEVVGDAIAEPLDGARGDPVRGRAIVVDRQLGLCLLCHSGPFPDQRAQGDLAPSLEGAGTRWTQGQLRLRIVDSRRLDPESLMPSYYRIEGLQQVGAPWAQKPVLDAQQIEDVVAFLMTLRNRTTEPTRPDTTGNR